MPTTNPTGEQLAKLIDVRIQEKFDTLANGEKNNPVLLRGEMGFAALDINNGMDVGNIRVKIGDGKHTGNELGGGALGPTGVNIHMSKDPITTNPETLETYFEYSSLVSPTGDIKVGDVVIDHVGTKSDNLYEEGWDGEINFFKIVETNDAAQEARVEPGGETLTIKGKSGATGPTGANPAESKLIPNDAYLHDYRSAELCGGFYASTGNTVQNKPAQVDSFTLCVYRKGDNQYIHELYDQNNRVGIETYNGTEGTSWKEKAVGIESVTSSFNFTNTGNSGKNTGTITVTLDNAKGTSNSHNYEVRNGIGITNVELVKPSPVQTTGSVGNTYTLNVNKSEGGATDTHTFTVYNGNGIAALRAVADATSDADSGTSKYHLEYQDTDRKTGTTITDSNFTVQNGQGLVKLEITGTANTKDSGSTEGTINGYYSDNSSKAVKIGTITTYNGQGLVSMSVSGTQVSTADSGTSTYTLYAKYSDNPNQEVNIGTFKVKNGSAGSTPANAEHIENGTNLNTYTYDKAGGYYASGGNNCPNRPDGVDAFGLEVLRSAQGWTVQICYPSNNSTNKMFIRNSNNGSGSAWQEKGLQGVMGPTGLTGPTGPTGSLGPTGIAGASGGVELYSYDVCFTTASNITHPVAVSFKVLSHVDLNVSNNAQDIIDILNLEDVSHDGVSCHGYVKDCGEAFGIKATQIDSCEVTYKLNDYTSFGNTNTIFAQDISGGDFKVAKTKIGGSQATLNNFSLSGNVLYINDVTTRVS